jgi:hypothetical protein
MQSTDIDISFKAARIVAHLFSDGINSSPNSSIDFNILLDELVSILEFQKIHS